MNTGIIALFVESVKGKFQRSAVRCQKSARHAKAMRGKGEKTRGQMTEYRKEKSDIGGQVKDETEKGRQGETGKNSSHLRRGYSGQRR